MRVKVQWLLGCYVCLAAICLVSCQTARTPPADVELVPPPPPPEFTPTSFLSGLCFERGAYPELFSAESRALWVGSDISALRRSKAVENGEAVDPKLDAAAARIAEDYLIIEADIVSVFGDMSIAYDVVGFRGITAYLLTAEGGRVPPIQTVLGTSATEEQREALKLFRRTNLIVFPKRDLWRGTPTLGPDTPAVRLVLEGYDSVFYFPWTGSGPIPRPHALTMDEQRRALKTGFKQFYAKVLALAHTFD